MRSPLRRKGDEGQEDGGEEAEGAGEGHAAESFGRACGWQKSLDSRLDFRYPHF